LSPLSLRRYRAERLLRSEFDTQRARVTSAVRARLGAAGASLDPCDLDACYAQAWQGLYAATLEGQEIENPVAWLVLVTFRRAIEEHRAQRGAQGRCTPAPREPDLAADLDDRVRLRQLFEGLCARLSAREREAATLCYLQGLSRSEAAARLGLSELRMRRLMDGRGAGRPGVAGKVGALVATIGAGEWCEEQGSLMRGLAYGVLDPGGRRYELALLHSNECPACRAYVASLRGLAASLPPAFPPGGLVAAVLARLLDRAPAGRAGAAAGHGAGGATGQIPPGSGAGLPLTGTLGATGAGGGGWLLSAGAGAKLAVGCLLALGVGAGCLTLAGPPPRAPRGARRASSARVRRVAAAGGAGVTGPAVPAPPPAIAARAAGAIRPLLSPSATASREFGPEQMPVAAAPTAATRGQVAPARSASARTDVSDRGEFAPARAASTSGAGAATVSSGHTPAATREFAPG